MKKGFIHSVTQSEIKGLEDIFSDERLIKYLWIEFILNPEAVKESLSLIDNKTVKKALLDASSWYLSFRWLLPPNKELELLVNKGIVTPYRIKYREYQEKKRNFLKGLLYAGLC